MTRWATRNEIMSHSRVVKITCPPGFEPEYTTYQLENEDILKAILTILDYAEHIKPLPEEE